MSRRGRHGRPGGAPRPGHSAAASGAHGDARANSRPDTRADARSDARPAIPAAPPAPPAPRPGLRTPEAAEAPAVAPAPVSEPAPVLAPAPVFAAAAPVAESTGDGGPDRPACTVAQLRRFIKSRPWIPMHELRRRFGIMGFDDDVTPMRVADHTLFVGLPVAEGRILAELLTGGDVGYELSVDPLTPVVIGVYPMRPVPRA